MKRYTAEMVTSERREAEIHRLIYEHQKEWNERHSEYLRQWAERRQELKCTCAPRSKLRITLVLAGALAYFCLVGYYLDLLFN